MAFTVTQLNLLTLFWVSSVDILLLCCSALANSDIPPKPSVWITSVSETTINIKWDQKDDIFDITHYVLYYKSEYSSWIELAFPSSDNSDYQLANLDSGTVYQFYMRAIGKRGTSDASDILTIRTKGNVPAINLSNKGVVQRQVPPYFRSSVVIPVTIAIVIIVIACAVAYAYIKIEDINASVAKAAAMSQSPSKQFQYINTAGPQQSARQSVVSEEGSLSFRYTDSSDKSKPLLARPPIPTILWVQQQEPIIEEDDEFPSPYGTLPFQKLTSFKSPPMPTQPPPPPPVPEARKHAYDEKGLLCHTPPQSSNFFCKVDVHNHNQDSGDSCDEFYKPQFV